jgi:hypothetical protein
MTSVHVFINMYIFYKSHQPSEHPLASWAEKLHTVTCKVHTDDEEKEHKKQAFISFRAAAGNMCHQEETRAANSKDTSSSLTSASQRDIKAQK